MDNKNNDNKNPKFLDFPNIPSNASKEVFQKERKYDSFVDEYRRIIQFGRSGKVALQEDNKKFFIDLVLDTFKKGKFSVVENDLFEGNIIYVKDNKGNIKNRAKITTFLATPKRSALTFQVISKQGEIRTSIKLDKPYFNFNSKKFQHITFEQLFKRANTFFGLKDQFRKRFMARQVTYKAAVLFNDLSKAGFYYKKLPEWATKILARVKSENGIRIR